jgi:hypothetical protein
MHSDSTLSHHCQLAAAAHQREGRQRLRALIHEWVANRVRLRRGSRIARLLRHRLFVYANQRLAVGAVQVVHPARLARLINALALHTAVRLLEQDGWAWSIEVPDIVVHLLKVPFVLAGFVIQGHE